MPQYYIIQFAVRIVISNVHAMYIERRICGFAIVVAFMFSCPYPWEHVMYSRDIIGVPTHIVHILIFVL